MFIEEVKKIMGNRGIREFSKDTNISASYICGILKGEYIPSAKIISKMTSSKQKQRKLMKEAGYLWRNTITIGIT